MTQQIPSYVRPSYVCIRLGLTPAQSRDYTISGFLRVISMLEAREQCASNRDALANERRAMLMAHTYTSGDHVPVPLPAVAPVEAWEARASLKAAERFGGFRHVA